LSGVLSGSLIGIILGVCAGYFGKKVDAVISRIIDVMLAFPSLLLAMAVVAILGNGLFNTAVAIAIFSIPSMARMFRGVVIGLKNSQYISATKVMGSSSTRILVTHIIPNAISQIIVNITLNLGTAILTSSSLSFLGLGVQPPNPEWGAMLSKARDVLRLNPSEALFPGLAITLVVMSFSLVGDGLRDALDPKLKNIS
jgi:peptide/nickel transport system permease protein